jgi:hypothetical protein
VLGTIHATDAVAGNAQADTTTAYNTAAGEAPDVVLPSADLTGLTLHPGVYQNASAVRLDTNGTLTLNGQGNPASVFIFQVGSTLTTGTNSKISYINGAQPCNVFWQVGSSATLGTSSLFVGTILADQSISVSDTVTVHGRLLASNGAVTLIDDTITPSNCATPGSGGSGGSGGTGGTGTGGSGGTGTGGTTTPVTTPPKGTPVSTPPKSGTTIGSGKTKTAKQRKARLAKQRKARLAKQRKARLAKQRKARLAKQRARHQAAKHPTHHAGFTG